MSGCPSGGVSTLSCELVKQIRRKVNLRPQAWFAIHILLLCTSEENRVKKELQGNVKAHGGSSQLPLKGGL